VNEKETKQTLDLNLKDSVEYARRVFEHNFNWYKNADSKAEIILAIDGIFLGFVTSSIFIKQSELVDILQSFKSITWFLLGLMSLCLTGSIISSVACLWSRIPIFTKCARKDYFAKKGIDAKNIETYIPEATWFFQKISWLDPNLYQELMLSTGKQFEISALAIDIHELSRNVLKKHKWVDISFFLAAISLLCFLAFGISYLITLM
jgi:hypothetical protein